jgi:pseudouridine synthase
VLDLVQTTDERTKSQSRLYPVGRLDTDSTGLILLTNDGDLTFRLTHPKFGVEKEYRVLVRGRPNAEQLKKLREGVEIEGEMTAPAKVEEKGRQGDHTFLSVTIHEGRKRQVRLMCAAVGHPVIELERVRFGPVSLGNLQQGKWRYLALHEVHALRKAVRLHATARK